MNERIRELLQESYTHFGQGKYRTPELVAEKFAELILQDIDEIIVNLYHAMPLEQAAVLLTLDENVKEHFYGVEE
jgi:hypothetical protein